MFFADRIKSIGQNDRVLEVGPGADPFFRSNVLLELKFDSEAEYHKQLGHSNALVTDKQVVYYDGGKFPFADKEFDYIICSHVLEHVEEIPGFLSEVFRVAKKGYFEFPKVYYEYLYNISAHLNILKFENCILTYMKKEELPFNSFKPVQEFMLQSLQRGHVKMINDLLPFFVEGFEWSKPFDYRQTHSISDIALKNVDLPWPPKQRQNYSLRFLAGQMLRKLLPFKK